MKNGKKNTTESIKDSAKQTAKKIKKILKPGDRTEMNLDNDSMSKAKEIANSIDHTQTDSVLNFAIDTQSKLGKYSNELLEKIKTKDAGDVGEVINDLMHNLNYIDIDGMADKKSVLSKLPIVGKFFDTAQKSLTKYNSVSDNINNITVRLDESRVTLLRDSATMSNLFDKNVSYIQEMKINIQAGYLKVDEITGILIPKKKEEIKNDPENQLLLQELNDLQQYVNNLEKKIHDLDLSKTVAMQNLPQIRMIQNNTTNLVEKIQSSVLTTIPLWKNQVTMALALNKQNDILSASKMVTDTTNQLLSNNADLLSINSVEVARQNEEGIVDIKTIKDTNKKLIETIKDISKIKEEGRKNRINVAKELKAVEKELADEILNTVASATRENMKLEQSQQAEVVFETIEETDDETQYTSIVDGSTKS